MKSIVLISLALTATALAATVGFGQEKSQLNIKYDKKKDLTTVRVKPLKLSPVIVQNQSSNTIPLHQMILDITLSHPGTQPTKPIEDVEFRFLVSSSNYVFLRSQVALAVLDNDNAGTGRAFQLGTTDYKSYAPKFNSVFEEALVVTAPAEAIVKMANANSLSLYLGPVEYPVSKSQLESLKEFARLVSQAATAKKS